MGGKGRETEGGISASSRLKSCACQHVGACSWVKMLIVIIRDIGVITIITLIKRS